MKIQSVSFKHVFKFLNVCEETLCVSRFVDVLMHVAVNIDYLEYWSVDQSFEPTCYRIKYSFTLKASLFIHTLHPYSSFTALRLMRAIYSPPAIRHWVQDQETELSSREIDCQRYSCRRGIRKDGTNNTPTRLLHNHFCLNQGDRELAFHEGMGDIEDAVGCFLICR